MGALDDLVKQRQQQAGKPAAVAPQVAPAVTTAAIPSQAFPAAAPVAGGPGSMTAHIAAMQGAVNPPPQAAPPPPPPPPPVVAPQVPAGPLPLPEGKSRGGRPKGSPNKAKEVTVYETPGGGVQAVEAPPGIVVRRQSTAQPTHEGYLLCVDVAPRKIERGQRLYTLSEVLAPVFDALKKDGNVAHYSLMQNGAGHLASYLDQWLTQVPLSPGAILIADSRMAETSIVLAVLEKHAGVVMVPAK